MFPKMIGGLYLLRKESNEKELQKFFMLLLQAEFNTIIIWVAGGRADRRATWQCMFGKGAGNSLENIAFGCQHTTVHDGVGKVLRFCLHRAKLTLSVRTCELCLLQLRGRTLQ